MADRRGGRASSRRKTPTPQPRPQAATPQVGRAVRNRTQRSASRNIEHASENHVPVRRSARQASVASVGDHDMEVKATRRTERKPAKDVVAGQ